MFARGLNLELLLLRVVGRAIRDDDECCLVAPREEERLARANV